MQTTPRENLMIGKIRTSPSPMLHVAPRDSIVDVVQRTGARHLVTCMIDGQPPTPMGIHPDRHLRLAMHDIEAPLAGYTAPGPEHITALLDFVDSWDHADPLLIHCYAGISRSTAAAFTTLCALNPSVDEAVLARSIRQQSWRAQPNRLFVSHADRLLSRSGRMISAIESIGPGDLSGLNEPFVLSAIVY